MTSKISQPPPTSHSLLSIELYNTIEDKHIYAFGNSLCAFLGRGPCRGVAT